MQVFKHMAAAVFALAAVTAAAQADTCSRPAIAQAAANLTAARLQLLALPAVGEIETEVPMAARQGLVNLKNRIAAFTASVLACQPADADPRAIAAELKRLGAPPDPKTVRRWGKVSRELGDYGGSLSFDVQPRSYGRLGITANFAIKCGADEMLMVFVQHDGWREALRIENDNYKEVSGGAWTFNYALSPPDAQGAWFVATKYVAPWCSSFWSGIVYGIYRPTGDPMKPRKLLAGDDFMWWGDEDYGRLRAGAGDFELHFHSTSIDGGVHNREWIRHYAVVGNAVRRIPPLADSPRDFADEWIQLTWPGAAPWTVPQAAERLQGVHAAVHKIGYFDYISIRRCAGPAVRTQIEVEDTGKPHYFFEVKGDKDFVMLDVLRSPDPTCTGPNQYPSN